MTTTTKDQKTQDGGASNGSSGRGNGIGDYFNCLPKTLLILLIIFTPVLVKVFA